MVLGAGSWERDWRRWGKGRYLDGMGEMDWRRGLLEESLRSSEGGICVWADGEVGWVMVERKRR